MCILANSILATVQLLILALSHIERERVNASINLHWYVNIHLLFKNQTENAHINKFNQCLVKLIYNSDIRALIKSFYFQLRFQFQIIPLLFNSWNMSFIAISWYDVASIHSPPFFSFFSNKTSTLLFGSLLPWFKICYTSFSQAPHSLAPSCILFADPTLVDWAS